MMWLLLVGCAHRQVLDCSRSIDQVEALPPEYGAVLDSVAFDTREVGAHEVDGATWAKTGLLVRAGVASTVIAPRGVEIEWGSERASRLDIPACDGDGWLAFAGGVWAAAPTCVTLTVRTDDVEEPARIGVGASCE